MAKKKTIKTPEEIAILREAGRNLARVLAMVENAVRPGITTAELDHIARKGIEELGDEPSFLNYQPGGADRPFPATLCVSVNNEVVHGVPGNRVLKEGDIVGLDLGLWHNDLCVDSAVTVGVGAIDDDAKRLIRATKEGLMRGIESARGGNTIGDIGAAVEACAKPHGYGIVRELGGHGVGYAVHETPYIPNYGTPGTGPTLMSGMVLAIEPMFNEGKDAVRVGSDGFTFETRDGSRSAHFEHTVLITDGSAEILTKI